MKRSLTLKGTHIFTDKDHFLSKQPIFPSLKIPHVETLTIEKNALNGFQGFGVAITPSSCFQLSLMAEEERTAFLKNIYTKDGLGLSVGRLCIGSSDYSAELYSYDDVPFDTQLRHFSIDRDRAYVIPMIKEILKINPDMLLFASPWSPPGWMKTGGSMCGGYMRSQYVDCYADYIVKFILAYADEGIKISAITPQNEPNTQQKGLMPACIWHPEIEAAFIKTLHTKLKDANLDVKIWMFDHNFADANRVLWTLDQCDGVKECCDGVAFHYYEGSIEYTKILQNTYPSLDLHFTEGGPRLYDNYDVDYCKWGIMISLALSQGYKSFTGWNLLLNEMGGPNIGPFFCGGLVTRHSITGGLSYSGQYKALCHIAPYITKDSDIYSLSSSGMFGASMFEYPKAKRELHGIAIDNHDGRNVLVVVNPNEGKSQTQFSVNDQNFYAELMPNSISTIIIS